MKRWGVAGLGLGGVAVAVIGAAALFVARDVSATAHSAQFEAWQTAKGYLPKGAVDGVALLSPPPTPESLAGQADKARFEDTRAMEGSPRWSLAAQDADLKAGVLHRFSCAVGARVGPGTPVLQRLLFKLQYDVRDTGDPPKDRYARNRPLIGNDKPICVKREAWMAANGSYPSGHSMIGWSWGLVLSELAPDRTNALMENAYAFGESRVICGMHYESDVEAGRILASAMVAREHADPVFRADLARAKVELARARKGPQPEDCGIYAGG